MAVKAIPDGYNGAIPAMAVRDAAGAIEFYKKAFGATESLRLTDPAGKVVHAEVKIGNFTVMFGEENPQYNASPETLGGTSVKMVVYVEDVDALFDRATAAGATVKMPLTDEFYGDRMGGLADPYGHQWLFATRKEEVSAEEMQKRFDAMMKAA